MEVVKKIVGFFIDILRYHKKKIFVMLLSIPAFIVLLFPFDDLSDYTARKIADMTGNQVILQFDTLSFDVWPQVGLGVENVTVDTPQLPTIEAGYLSLAPSILGFLSFRPGFVAKAREIFGGDVDLEMKTVGKADQGLAVWAVGLDADHIDLAKLRSTFDLPVALKGRADVSSQIKYDASLVNQPDGDVHLELDSVSMPASTVPTAFGPIALPGLKWAKVDLKGRMVNSRFVVEDGVIGEGRDPLKARIKGGIDMRLDSRGGAVSPVFGAFDFKVELNVDKSVESDLKFLLGFFTVAKAQTMSGSRYLFQVSGAGVGGVPNIQPITSF